MHKDWVVNIQQDQRNSHAESNQKRGSQIRGCLFLGGPRIKIIAFLGITKASVKLIAIFVIPLDLNNHSIFKNS